MSSILFSFVVAMLSSGMWAAEFLVRDTDVLFVIGGSNQTRLVNKAMKKVRSFTPGTGFTSKAPMSVPRSGLCVATVDNKIYAMGGLGDNNNQHKSVEIYDKNADKWSAGPDMLNKRVLCAAAAIKKKIYICGGSPPTNLCEMLDTSSASNGWVEIAPMLYKFAAPTAVAVGDRFYLMGGYPDGGALSMSNMLFVYDPSANKWSQLASMTMPRQLPTATVLRNAIYVCGTNFTSFACVNSKHEQKICEKYNVTQDKWTQLPPTSLSRGGGHQIVALSNRIYALGGSSGVASACNSKKIESYNPNTNTWRSERAKLPTFMNRFAAVVC